MPGKVKGSSKKFDQKIQTQYEKLSVEEQKDNDQTFEAIRLLKNSQDDESKKILETYKARYTKPRKWAVFQDFFVKQA